MDERPDKHGHGRDRMLSEIERLAAETDRMPRGRCAIETTEYCRGLSKSLCASGRSSVRFADAVRLALTPDRPVCDCVQLALAHRIVSVRPC